MKNIRKVTEAVYDMLMSASFETWYEDEFMAHVRCDEDCPTRTHIEDRIQVLIERNLSSK